MAKPEHTFEVAPLTTKPAPVMSETKSRNVAPSHKSSRPISPVKLSQEVASNVEENPMIEPEGMPEPKNIEEKD